MLNDYIMAIMDADMLAEICHVHLVLRHERTEGSSIYLTTWAWSFNSTMAAVTVSCPDHWATPEVQIHDTVSGQRIQSWQEEGKQRSIARSSSLNKYATCNLPSCYRPPDDSSNSDDWSSGYTCCTIYVHDATLQELTVVPETSNVKGFIDCRWTPCGTLLMVDFDIPEVPEEDADNNTSDTYILDPCSLKLVHECESDTISWGSSGSLKKPAQPLIAWMSDLHLQVTFWQVNGEWHTRSICRDIQMKI